MFAFRNTSRAASAATCLLIALALACTSEPGGTAPATGGVGGMTGGTGGMTTGGAGGMTTGGAGGMTGGAGGMTGGMGGAAGMMTGGMGGMGGMTGGMGGGGGSGGMTGGMGGDGGMTGGMGGMAGGEFTLTSDAFEDGGMLPAEHRCVALGGETGPSPAFMWSNPPAGTMSFALLMTDNSNDYAHWTIFDIPAATTSLAEGVMRAAMPSAPAGAKQIDNQDANIPGPGYFGPCHPFATNPYEFTLYAIDVPTLPDVGVDSTRAEVQTAVDAHDLGSVSITAMSGP